MNSLIKGIEGDYVIIASILSLFIIAASLTNFEYGQKVGLMVAGIGVSSGVLSSNVYSAIIIMVAVTTVITPVWLKKAYSREPGAANETS